MLALEWKLQIDCGDMTRPDYELLEEFTGRVRKLDEVRASGVEPYPAPRRAVDACGTLAAVWEKKELSGSEEAAAGQTPPAAVAGRLVLFRAMGKNAFGHLQDETGRIQIMCNRELTEVVG